MGNNSGKKECDPCEKNLDELFGAISNKKGYILRSDLKKVWAGQIDEDLYNDIELYLFKANQNNLTSQTFKKLFSDICKGTTEDKVDVLCKLMGDRDEISRSRLLKFVTNILNSILIIQKTKSPKRYNSWCERIGNKKPTESITELSTYFLDRVAKQDQDEYMRDDLASLIIHFDFYLHMVLSRMYDTEEKHFYTCVLPEWKSSPVDTGKTLNQFSILNLCKIMFLNSELPIDYQHKWRPLFSTEVHGESFSKLSGQILNQGPTLIIIKDKDGYVFGGFAPSSWSLSPIFSGDSRSFLFTLEPKMNLFVATNFNSNYQYMNVGQQTMPNGLGFGGKLEYFGLWISAEFGKGYCSESCTTYREYKMMSKNKEFDIAHLEVWAVGPPPLSPSELGERSVLDSNIEAKAILEMAGKTAYSDGLREEPID
ncbi:hypothetical protein RUM43_000242 [Polyplax serrata]|uniref:MTOR-associated protein MEAK7 n=1 Tax=Polyplax serrata TaxID=468196 RepID=A0AAN8XRX2_POLSC